MIDDRQSTIGNQSCNPKSPVLQWGYLIAAVTVTEARISI